MLDPGVRVGLVRKDLRFKGDGLQKYAQQFLMGMGVAEPVDIRGHLVVPVRYDIVFDQTVFPIHQKELCPNISRQRETFGKLGLDGLQGSLRLFEGDEALLVVEFLFRGHSPKECTLFGMARFIFSIVKFTPGKAYVNIGAIVGNPETNIWNARLLKSMERAERIDTGGELSTIVKDLQEMGAVLTGWVPHKMPSMNEGRLWELYGMWKRSVRLTEPLFVEAPDETSAFKTVFRYLITDPFQSGPLEKKTVDKVLVLASDGQDVLRGINKLLKPHHLSIRQRGNSKELGDQRFLVLEPTD